jgi:hypothetical protein
MCVPGLLSPDNPELDCFTHRSRHKSQMGALDNTWGVVLIGHESRAKARSGERKEFFLTYVVQELIHRRRVFRTGSGPLARWSDCMKIW